MKILIVIPRYNLTNKRDYEYAFPFGLGYISSALKNAGYSVDCLNLNHFDGTIEYLMNKILDSKKYDIVCSGHMGIGYTVIEKIINSAKAHKSKPKIIIGGTIITAESKLMFESLKPDFGVIGEGDITIIELIKCLENKEDLKKVNGIVYWENGGPIFTKPRELINDLDSLPTPDFQGIGFKEQLDNMGSNSSPYGLFDEPRVYPILCSRGCPFQCTFCYHSIGMRYRIRSIRNIMKELEGAVKRYKINTICIYDDLFSLNKERLYKFCREIKKLINKLQWECKWTCQLSVRDVDKEMLEKLKDAGCYAVSYGFESYSQKVLNSMKKPITPKQIDNAIKLMKETGLSIQGNFIFGDIAETKESAKETLDYWKKNCSGEIYLGFIQPYPGSKIYERCIQRGIIKDRLDFIKNKMNITNWFNMTDSMTDEEVLQLKKDILEARRKYAKYVVPLKIRKKKGNRYSVLVECPFCKKKINYRNFSIQDRILYTFWISCRSCKMRFSVVSRIYKFGVNHYEKIDFLRRNYLLIRNAILKRKM